MWSRSLAPRRHFHSDVCVTTHVYVYIDIGRDIQVKLTTEEQLAALAEIR